MADHRIELALHRSFREIDAVFLECLSILLGAGVLHLRAAANLLDRLFERGALGARGFQDASELAAIVAGGQDEQLARDELIAAFLRELIGHIEQLVEIVADEHIAAGTLHCR